MSLHTYRTFSADLGDKSVDVEILTNGGTYHKVVVETTWDDGRSDREVYKCFSRGKAESIARYRTNSRALVNK